MLLPWKSPSRSFGWPLSQQALAEEYMLMTKIGKTVERFGENRDGVLAALPEVLEVPLKEDHIEIAEAFLAGLRLPEVESIL